MIFDRLRVSVRIVRLQVVGLFLSGILEGVF